MARKTITPADAFLRSIHDAPDDDAPRLVFADWLEERGDPRGEFLRLQTERAAWVPDVHRRDAMHRREAELMTAHQAEWLGELAGLCQSWRFRRGFTYISMEADRFLSPDFRRRGPRLLRDAWVGGFTLLNLRSEHLPALPAPPELEAFRNLDRFSRPTPRLRNSRSMDLALIPAGSFLMGAPENQPGSRGDEKPQHEVGMTRPFYLGVRHVTQDQFNRLMHRNPSHFVGDNVPSGIYAPGLPIDSVSPEDAHEFCRRLSALPEEKKRGRVYRLPTEAQWEYACRAGSPSDWPFWFGRFASSHQINCKGTEPYGEVAAGPVRDHPAETLTFEPNDFGLYDMHGNLWDWTADYYDPSYFQHSPRQDPPGPDVDSRSVLKGGSWFNGAAWCRSASRYGSTNDCGSYCISFRVAMDVTNS
jgi:uncharacterized protein (TIGR02996 family)